MNLIDLTPYLTKSIRFFICCKNAKLKIISEEDVAVNKFKLSSHCIYCNAVQVPKRVINFSVRMKKSSTDRLPKRIKLTYLFCHLIQTFFLPRCFNQIHLSKNKIRKNFFYFFVLFFKNNTCFWLLSFLRELYKVLS